MKIKAFLTAALTVLSGALCAQQFIASPEVTAVDWSNCPVLTEKSSVAEYSLQSCYTKDKIYLFLKCAPEKALEKPELSIYLKPFLQDNQSRVLISMEKEYFTIQIGPKGLIKSDYPGATVKVEALSNNGFTAEVTLELLENALWLKNQPKPGEYYLITAALQVANVKYPYIAFNNYTRPFSDPVNMARIVFCGKEIPANLPLFFDNEHLYGEAVGQLTEDIGELKAAGQMQVAAALAKERENWQAGNDGFTPSDYFFQRYYRLEALKKLAARGHDLRIRYLADIMAQKRQKALLTVHPCYDDSRLTTPSDLPKAVDLKVNKISLQVCPEETTAFSTLLWSPEELRNVSFKLEPFKNAKGQSASAEIGEYYVKCWYQGGRPDGTRTGKGLMPELLLKNPDLVRIDRQAENNLLAVHQYSIIERVYPDDSPALQPLSVLPAGFAQQLWINIRFPEGTQPGLYRSTITATDAKGGIASFPVEVEVLEFKLDRSNIKNYFYTYSRWGQASDELALAEIASLKSHGVDTVGLYEKTENLPRVIELMKKGGLFNGQLFLQGDGDHVFYSDMSTDKATEKVKKVLDTVKDCGVTDVYFYLPDEASGERLKKSIPIADAIHRAGGKTWGAVNRHWYAIGGKIFDHVNVGGYPVPRDMVKKVHDDGHEIFVYNNPQGGIEFPGRFRRNYGMQIWTSDYDGGMTWAWWWPFGKDHRDVWNDFDDPFWRDHCMVYPTANGVVSTIQFEGYLKGINDTRYLGTLLNLLKQIPEDNAEAKPVRKYLKDLKAKDWEYLRDLDLVRSKLIEGIRICNKILK